MPDQPNHDEPSPEGEGYPTADQLTGAGVGHIAYSAVLALLADNATMLVPTTVQKRRGTAGLTRATVELRRVLNELLNRAITTDRANGATWDDIANALRLDPDITAIQYAHLDWAHLAHDPRATWDAYHRSCPSQLHDICCPADPAAAARQLDLWYEHHADPRDPAPTPSRAVTAGL